MPKANHDASVKRTGFKKGDEPPYAYNDTWKYPDDYRPWTFYYKGDGVLVGMLALLFFAYFKYEETYLNKTGRLERPEKKDIYRI